MGRGDDGRDVYRVRPGDCRRRTPRLPAAVVSPEGREVAHTRDAADAGDRMCRGAPTPRDSVWRPAGSTPRSLPPAARESRLEMVLTLCWLCCAGLLAVTAVSAPAVAAAEEP